MQAPPVTARRKRTIAVRIILALVAVILALIIDLQPAVRKPAAPRAEQVALARDLAKRVRTALSQGAGRATVGATGEELASAAVLTSDLERIARVDARIEGSDLKLVASRRLLGPLWLNAFATVKPTPRGFPETYLRVGRLPFGATLSKLLISTGARLFRWRGVRIPPLDTLVSRFDVRGSTVAADVYFPLGSGFAKDLARMRQAPVDPDATIRIYCDLVARDRAEPTNDFAAIVRRAFATDTRQDSAVERNRAAFVAIAMYTVEPAAGRFDERRRAAAVRCARSTHAAPILATRTDLAKHWSLSAALSVSLGDDLGRAMGEWKELADSRPDGTGFSFVDLAADRAGLAIAAAATNPASAERVAEKLRAARNRDLLPIGALALSEGLSEAAFVADYGTIDSEKFAEAKARIDRVLSRSAIR